MNAFVITKLKHLSELQDNFRRADFIDPHSLRSLKIAMAQLRIQRLT